MKHATNLRNAAIRLRFPSCNYISRVNDLTPYEATHTSKSQLHYLSVYTKTQTNHREQKRN